MKERKAIVLTAILNALVATLKLILGITFSFSTLIADSVQSFIDFFTDIVSLITSKIGKKKIIKLILLVMDKSIIWQIYLQGYYSSW